jgi:hypothetical protein
MKTGPDTVGTAENGAGSAKHEKQNLTPSVPPKTGPGAQNMKTELTPSVPPKQSPGAQNMKTGPEAVDNAENGFGSAKH